MLTVYPPLALELEALTYLHHRLPQFLASYLDVHCDRVPDNPDCRLSFLTAHIFLSIHLS